MTNLKAVRENKGISQTLLASLSGVNIKLIREFESRERDINTTPAVTVYKLAKVLGCHVEELLEDER